MKKIIQVLSLFILTFSCLAQNKILEKANKIHEVAITIDTHADVPIMMAKEGFNINDRHDWIKDGSQIDYPRMIEGGMDAMFFAVYLAQGKRNSEANIEAKQKAIKIFDMIDAAVINSKGVAEKAVSVADVKRIHASGKRIVLLGMENGWPIGNDLKNLDYYYGRGLRYITLSHSFNNDICDSSGDPEGPEFNGLSPFGEKVVERMNQLGMMVDVSHVSDSSFFDVMKLTKVPVIASHSSCRALCAHKRNMTDEMIIALGKKGGVIQINFVPDFIKKPSAPHEVSLKELRMKMMRAETTIAEQAEIDKELNKLKEKYKQDLPTVADAVDHIEHVIKLVGINHVGIGMDMDGGGELVGCMDVSEIKNITVELLKRGYSGKEIKKIWGGNLLRVMSEVEKYALEFKK